MSNDMSLLETNPNSQIELGEDASSEDAVWPVAYESEKEGMPSWDKHGLPYLMREFLQRIAQNPALKGVTLQHVDIGCGDAKKTAAMAKGLTEVGVTKVIGIDKSDKGFSLGRDEAKLLGIDESILDLRKGDSINMKSLPDHSVTSLTDILMGTHLIPEKWPHYIAEIKRVTRPGAEILTVFFSASDKHFHGRPVNMKGYPFTPRYFYKLADVISDLEPDIDRYKHYAKGKGMYNTHLTKEEAEQEFGQHFKDVRVEESNHPVYPHRKLINILARVP